MEERYIYIPKQYFYSILIISSIIIAAIFLDLYLIGTSFYNLTFVFLILIIFLIVIIFSYLSYKKKIPYLIEYNGNLYASKYQVILAILIFTILFTLIPGIFSEINTEAIITISMIIATGIVVIIFTYLSYKRKIPLLGFKD